MGRVMAAVPVSAPLHIAMTPRTPAPNLLPFTRLATVVRAVASVLLLAIAAGGCGLLFRRDLPRHMVGLHATFSARDDVGLAQVRKLHGRKLEIQSGAFAIYGSGKVSIWVAGARDTAVAQRLIRDMTARIGEGDSPFRPESTWTAGTREVREVSGLGQRHFYFRSGRHLVWLAANRSEADAALGEALRFYR